MNHYGPAHRFFFLVLLLLLCTSALLNGCAGIVKTPSQSIAALFQLNPANINFGTVTVGKRITQSVTVSNTGTVSVHITQATFSNSQFSLSGTTLPMALPAGQSGTLTVGVTAAAAGDVTGLMTVTGDSESTPATVNLSANAVAASQPQLSVSPGSISFGTVSVGSNSTSNLILSNTGSANLTVSMIALSGSEFAIKGVTTPATISAGQSVQATVTFTPTTAAAATGSVTIASNDPNNPTVTVALSGTGSSAPTGQLSATPVNVSFGNIAVGATASQQIVLANTGNAAVHISSISINGSAYKVSGMATPATVNPSASVTLSCTFAPSMSGNATGSITIASDAGNSSLVIGLNGTGTEGALSISPASFNFGSIVDGQTKSQSFTLTNTGTASLTISQISETGAGFSVGGLTTPATLVPGATASFSVVFAPTTVGNLTGNLTVTSNDPGNPTMTVLLNGTGTAVPTGQLSTSPATVNFGTVAVGASANQQIVLSNSGNAAVHISSFTVSGSAYQVNGVTAPMTINPSTSVTLTATFSPSTTGNATGSITIASDATDPSLAINLSGTGAQAGVSISPASYSFGSIVQGQTKSQSFTVTNTGTTSLTISQISISGNGFSVSGLTTPATVAVGTTASFNVLFAPATAGSLTGTVTITSNAPNSPTTVALSGTGTSATATLAASPSNLSFANINVGSSTSQAVTITNTGNSSAVISQISVSAKDFSTSGLSASTTLAAGQSATLNVTFSPTSSENVTGNITVSSSQGTSTVISVSGGGVQPAINVTPASFNFGSIIDGQTKSQSFTLTNTGTAALTISQISETGSGFTVSGLTAPTAIPVGGTATFSVQFAPTTAGSLTGTVNITSNAPGSPTTVALTGTGTAATATLSVNPATLSFTGINVGTSSSQGVTITNTGNSSAVISQISVSAKDFSTSGLSASTTLAAGQSATLNVTFSPTSSENVTGNITVSSAQGTSTVISVSGGGVQPALTITPNSASFGNVTVGVSSTLTIQLANSGTGALSVTQINVSGSGFSTSSLNLPISLAAGQSSSFNVQFLPTSAGAVAGGLSIVSNAPNSPATVPLSGTGVAQTLTLSFSTTSLAFGNVNTGSSSTLPITVSNTGNGNVEISQISQSGASFTITGSNTPVTLTPNQSLTLNVIFSPTTAGSDSGTVTVVSNAAGSPATVSLSGTGITHAVTLTWTASTSTVSGYNMYRSTSSGSGYVKINTSGLITGLSYTDSTVQNGTTYYYVTTAVDTSGDESVDSNQATAVIP